MDLKKKYIVWQELKQQGFEMILFVKLSVRRPGPQAFSEHRAVSGVYVMHNGREGNVNGF